MQVRGFWKRHRKLSIILTVAYLVFWVIHTDNFFKKRAQSRKEFFAKKAEFQKKFDDREAQFNKDFRSTVKRLSGDKDFPVEGPSDFGSLRDEFRGVCAKMRKKIVDKAKEKEKNKEVEVNDGGDKITTQEEVAK